MAEVELWGYGAWWVQILTLLNYVVVVGIPSLVRTFSAEMRHMGTPTPGTVVPPTYSKPLTRREIFVPRKKADWPSVWPGPNAPPSHEW